MENSTSADCGVSLPQFSAGNSYHTKYENRLEGDMMRYFDLEAFTHDDHLPALNASQTLTNGPHLPAEQHDATNSAEVDVVNFERDVEDARRRYHEHTAVFVDELLPSIPADMYEQIMDSPDAKEVEVLDRLLRHPGQPVFEKWEVDRATAEFLFSIDAMLTEESAPAQIPVTLKDVKVEEPLLTTDHQNDMMAMYCRNALRIDVEGLDPFSLSDERDETLKWSKKSYDMLAKVEGDIADERLLVDKAATDMIREMHELPNDGQDEQWGQARNSKIALLRLSPVLLPPSSPYSAPNLPSDLAEIELTSSPEDPSHQELASLRASILERDSLPIETDDRTCRAQAQAESGRAINIAPRDGWVGSESAEEIFRDPLPDKSASLSDSAVYLKDLETSSIRNTPSPNRKRVRNLKVESPLLPASDSEAPRKKLKAMLSTEELPSLTPSTPPSNGSTLPSTTAENARASIVEILQPVAARAQEQLANEELSELDTVLRVPVPRVTDIVAAPPWKKYVDAEGNHRNLASQRRLLEETRSRFDASESRWAGASKEERLLQWTAFPSRLGRVKPEGDFDDGSLERYMAELGLEDGPLPSALTWKPEGLRVLDNCDDDGEELQPFEYEHGDRRKFCPAAETKAPKMTFIEPDPVTEAPSRMEEPQNDDRGWTGMDALLRKRKQELEKDQRKSETSSWSETPEQSSAHTHLISKFMQSRGRDAGTFCKPDAHASYQRHRAIPLSPDPPKTSEKTDGTTTMAVSIPAPELDRPQRAISIIVSPTTLAKRQLLRKLTELLPAMTLIERNPALVALQSGGASMQGRDEIEADLTISPSTGLMFTSLQKIKQRALPGQTTSFHGIRERILGVAPRYEQLMIMVSEGMSPSPTPQIQHLDERDCTAIIDLVELGSAVDTDIHISYIPGGEDTLAKWIAAAICRHGVATEEGADFSLLEDETSWERFLRAAGMNAFAAQAVLASVKPAAVADPTRGASMVTSRLDPRGGGGGARSGLAAFVTMDAAERVQRFAPLFGGARVLRRVGQAIDTDRWRSFHAKATTRT